MSTKLLTVTADGCKFGHNLNSIGPDFNFIHGEMMSRAPTLGPEEPLEIPSNFQWEQIWGYGLILVVAALAASVEPLHFAQLWKIPHHPDVALKISQLVFFAIVALFTYRWMEATKNELELWIEWTDLRLKPKESFGIITALAVYLGLLLASVHNPIVVTTVSTVGLLVNYRGQAVSNKTFLRAVERQGSPPIPPSMKRYWLELPHLKRILWMTVVSSVALVFTIMGSLLIGPPGSHLYLCAYLLLIADTVAAEFVVERWRRDRDRGIEAHKHTLE